MLFSNGCDDEQTQKLKTIDHLKKEIAVGLSRTEVEDILISEGIEHGWDSKNNTILAIIRDIGGGSFVSTSMQAVITIGPDEKVTSVEWKELHTGP